MAADCKPCREHRVLSNQKKILMSLSKGAEKDEHEQGHSWVDVACNSVVAKKLYEVTLLMHASVLLRCPSIWLQP